MKRGLGLYAAALYAFLHLPLVILTVFSFNSSRFTVWEGFSLDWYRAVISDPNLAEAALISVEIAIVSTILSTIVGTACAYGFWKRRDRLLSSALYLSLVTPEIVMGVSLLAFFQWAFRFLHWQLGLHTVILAHVAFSIAYVVIVVAARLRTLDASLEEAAMDLGADLDKRVSSSNKEGSHSFWSIDLVSRERHEIDVHRSHVHGQLSNRLSSVSVEVDAAFVSDSTNHFNWFDCANLIVSHHDGDEHSSIRDRLGNSVGIQ